MVAKNTSCLDVALRCLIAAGLSFATALTCAAPLYYYDGTIKRPLQIDAERWAATKADGAGKSIEIRAGSSAEKAAPKSMPGSPVFRSGDNGAPMALPGGVIVKQKVGGGSAETLLKSQGFEIERTIGNDSGTFLVKSAEGISSLELANKLHESGQFESVSPNWWRERRKK